MSGTDPFEEMERLFDQLSQFGGSVGGDLPVDVVDEDNAFVVVADLPGYETDDIDVELHDDHRLRVTAERDEASTAGDGEFIRRERRHQQASRTVTLPAAVDESETEANYENGVLTVRLGKQTVESDEGTDIPVN